MLNSRIRVGLNLEGEEVEGYLVEIVVIRDTPLGVVSVRGRGMELFYLNDLREIFSEIPDKPDVPMPGQPMWGGTVARRRDQDASPGRPAPQFIFDDPLKDT